MTEISHPKGTLPAYHGKDLISDIFSRDKQNYENAEHDYQEDIALLDDALGLYVSILKGAYTVKDRWQRQAAYEAPIILLSSVLNTLVLLRYSILAGYYSEISALFKNCYEGTTRSFLFWIDETEAEKFLSGEILPQKEVDKKLSALGEPTEKVKKAAYIAQRKEYENVVTMAYPGLAGFKFRYGDLEPGELREKIIGSPISGGPVSGEALKTLIDKALQSTLFAVSVIKSIFVDSSGSYENEYRQIMKRYGERTKQLSKE
jgi:hypothetical protein